MQQLDDFIVGAMCSQLTREGGERRAGDNGLYHGSSFQGCFALENVC